MRILNGLVGIALLGLGSVAAAGEPVKLSNSALDSVTAGVRDGFGLGFTFPAATQGASSVISQTSFVSTTQEVVLTPPDFQATFTINVQSQSISRVSGIGTTSAIGGGGVASGIFPAN